MRKLRVTVDGEVFEVAVNILNKPHSPKTTPPKVKSASVEKSLKASAGDDIKSPLAGKVVSIQTKEGDAVSEGDQLLTLEAMKMNTYIYAPKNGTIVSVEVKEGQTVDEDQVLIRMS